MNISDAAREAERLVFFGIEPTTQDTRGYIASEVSHDFRCADDPEEAANKLRWNNRCVTGLLLLITKQERELEATAALTLELEQVKRERDVLGVGVNQYGRHFRVCLAEAKCTCGLEAFITTPNYKEENDQLRQQLAEARELLKERVFWTANEPMFDRQGYSALIDYETAIRDVNYRNAPLYATAEEAIDAALKTLNPPTDEK